MKDIDGYVAKDNLYRAISRIKYKPDIVVDNTTCNIIIEAIYAMPQADVQPVKRGRWLHFHDDGIIFCSECEREAYWDSDGQQLFDYCPYCGADMLTGTKG